jgi:peptide-methionine (R)-S-oxide reductase
MAPPNDGEKPEKMEKTDAEWRAALTREEYEVLRRKGTERAFSGAHWNAHGDADYLCAGCGAELFSSKAKFDSGTGWPSFSAPAEPEAVATESDSSHGMRRTEVTCRRCGGHLGHLFEDGPAPTGQRYCINSVSLKAKPSKPEK